MTRCRGVYCARRVRPHVVCVAVPLTIPSHTHSISESEFMQYMEVENHDDFYSFNEEGHVRVWDPQGVAVVYDVVLDDLLRLERELLTLGSYYIMREGVKVSVLGWGCSWEAY